MEDKSVKCFNEFDEEKTGDCMEESMEINDNEESNAMSSNSRIIGITISE